ncbi:MAG: hypothetical protein NZ959_01945 [Armatimonadetes bacterium]|nr:hypothetical protein [Armatimonadota bacterium]MDW8120822.1 hypothetical protein [Armatimonadota bacterium]
MGIGFQIVTDARPQQRIESNWVARLSLLLVAVCVLMSLIISWTLPEQVVSLAKNGGFEKGTWFWSLTGEAAVVSDPKAPDGHQVLLCRQAGDGAFQTIIIERGQTYTVSAKLKTEKVVPRGIGFAYAAIYEFNWFGELVAFSDFAKRTGTTDWSSEVYTWQTKETTAYIEIRCGLYNADGFALFDDFRLNRGEKIVESEPTDLGRGSVALIFDEANLPPNLASPSVQQLETALQASGYQTGIVGQAELSNLDFVAQMSEQVSLIVFPNAPYFPISAHKGLLQLLTSGVDLMTFGGYAFDVPLVRKGDQFQPWTEVDQKTEQVLANPGFEDLTQEGLPIGWERTDQRACIVTQKEVYAGAQAAAVIIPADQENSATWHTQIPAEPGGTYRLSGWMKTEGIKGRGYAYLAYYPSAGDRWIAPRDIAQVKGSTSWQQYSAIFTVPFPADGLSIRFGIYLGSGAAFFDEIRLEKLERAPWINTRYGSPQDGLEISPLQLGLFDADYPLRKVRRVRSVVSFLNQWQMEAPESELSGFSACGVLRGNARWVPILRAEDRFGRLRGHAGAMMVHYQGPFTGSVWTFFGLDRRNLLDENGFSEKVLIPLLRKMRVGVYLTSCEFSLACYRPGQKPVLSLSVANFGPLSQSGKAEVSLFSVPLKGEGDPKKVWTGEIRVEAPAYQSQKVSLTVNRADLDEGLYRAEVRLFVTDQICDSGQAGFVVWDGKSFPRPLTFKYQNNYFHVNGRPTFLLGTDTWNNWFASPSQRDPLFWWEQIQKCRDFGVMVLENLQMWTPDYRYSEEYWSRLDAALYLCHQAGIVYMAGLLIGGDVAVDDETLSQQERFVAEFARRYRKADGLIYYINGDYQLRPKSEEQKDLKWQIQQTEKWNRRIVSAIRSEDPDHPITSEYYQVPIGGLDLRLTLDGLDVANIGYFDEPLKDILRFPAVFKMIDHRLYGKSLNVGEFGVKTHPAWARELGGRGYHIKRTEEDRWKLFLLIPHYAFGLGGSKVQNWCWRDDDDRVFPWGLNYTCDGLEREALKAYRAAALLLGRLRPVWKKPETLLVVSDFSRTSPEGVLTYKAALIGIDTLIRLRVDFAVASDLNVTEETVKDVKVIFIPGAQTLPGETEQVLKEFVQRGGILYRSGPKYLRPWEWEVAEVGQQTAEQRDLYRSVLSRARVSGIRVIPDLAVVHCFLVPLINGQALIIVNGSDDSFQGQILCEKMPAVQMELGPWETGLVVEENGRLTAVEGRGVIRFGGQRVAEGDGHYAVFSRNGEDIRETMELVFLPLGARKIFLTRHRRLDGSRFESGEWRDGRWHQLSPILAISQSGGISIIVPDDLTGDIVTNKGWFPPL